MTKKCIHLIAGARPNFVKVAPIIRELSKNSSYEIKLIHTGQHYDINMSKDFFTDLNLPTPDINLEVGSSSHANQTAQIMIRLEEFWQSSHPDLIIVVGDVNSTAAAAMVASKLCIPFAHVEAGLRSFDKRMPEEINRMITDSVCDYFFTTEEAGNQNLRKEGHPDKNIFFVGNVMIDTLALHLEKAKEREILSKCYVKPKQYVVCTLHRPSNVDTLETLEEILIALQKIGESFPVLFPVHPRTQKMIDHFELQHYMTGGIVSLPPISYLDMLCLSSQSAGIITDSGGLQEEGAYLRVPTLTLRENTERPSTIESGSNQLISSNKEALIKAAQNTFGKEIPGEIPQLWDGQTATRIVSVLNKIL